MSVEKDYQPLSIKKITELSIKPRTCSISAKCFTTELMSWQHCVKSYHSLKFPIL